MTFSALPATASRFTSHVAGGGARAALLALLGAAVLSGCAASGERAAGDASGSSRHESLEERIHREGAHEDAMQEQQARAAEQLSQDPGVSLSDLPPARLASQTSRSCLAAIETMAERFSGQRVLDQALAKGKDGQILDGKRLTPQPFLMQLRFGPRGCMVVVPAQSSATRPVPASQLLRECRCLPPPVKQ